MTLMSCAVSDDVSDSHCTPDDGDGKEGRKGEERKPHYLRHEKNRGVRVMQGREGRHCRQGP